MAHRFWKHSTTVLAATALLASLVAALLAVPLVVLAVALASAPARAVTLDDLLRQNIRTMDQLQNFLSRIAYESCEEIATAEGEDIYREYRELQAWRAESRRNLAAAEQARRDALAAGWDAARAYRPNIPVTSYLPPRADMFEAEKLIAKTRIDANLKALNDLRDNAPALRRFRADRRAVDGLVNTIAGASAGMRRNFRQVGTAAGYSRTTTTPAIQAEIDAINTAVDTALGTYGATYGGPGAMAPLPRDVDYDTQHALFAGVAARRNAVAALGARIDAHPEYRRLRDLERKKGGLEEENRKLRDQVRQLDRVLARIADIEKAQEEYEVTVAWEGMMAIVEEQIRACVDTRRKELEQAQGRPHEQGRLTAFFTADCVNSLDASFTSCIDGTFWMALDHKGRSREGESNPDCVSSPAGRVCGVARRWVRPATEFQFEIANGVITGNAIYSFQDADRNKVNGAFAIQGAAKATGDIVPYTYAGGGTVKGRETVFYPDGPITTTCRGRWQTKAPLKCK